MIDDQLKEQASLYVVRALPANEAAEFEETLRGNLELQVLVAELRPAVEAVAVALPRRTPSPAVRARLLREVEHRAAVVAVSPESAPATSLWSLLPWAIAACATFLCIYLATQQREDRIVVRQMEQRLQDAVAQADAAEKRAEAQRMEYQQQRDATNTKILSQAAEQMKRQASIETRLLERVKDLERRNADLVLRSPGTKRPAADGGDAVVETVIPAVPGGPGVANNAQVATSIGVIRSRVTGWNALGAAVWEPREQRGTITIDQLPLPAADKDYQLWLFADANPISAGLLTVDANGHVQANYNSSHPVETVIQWAISLEKKGGSQAPGGPVVMLSN